MDILQADILQWAEAYDGEPFHAGLLAQPIGPFAPHMTRWAERDQVTQIVGQSAVSEITKAANVMNRKCFAVLLLGYTAFLTGIVIAGTCSSPLRSPGWAVVAPIATAPRWIAFSAHTNISAQVRAKSPLVKYADFRAGTPNVLSAYLAIPFDPLNALWSMFVVWTRGAGLVRLLYFTLDNAKRSTFVQAVSRTNRGVLCITQPIRLCCKWFDANRTFNHYLLVCSI